MIIKKTMKVKDPRKEVTHGILSEGDKVKACYLIINDIEIYFRPEDLPSIILNLADCLESVLRRKENE